jgi:hypothetical protein
MRRINIALCALIFCGVLNACAAVAPNDNTNAAQDNEIAKLIGNWSGTSLCVNKEKFPGCNDEQVIYHVAAKAGKPDTVTITMDKIVNNKPEFMGEGDFVYDKQKQTLTTEYKNSRVDLIIVLSVKGDVLEGTVTSMPDKTIARQIKVTKDK